MTSFALRSTKWILDAATHLVKSNIRVHNADVVKPDMAVVFVANHFTRLETLLLPYEIFKHTGREARSLAAAELFSGPLDGFLRSSGAISTKDPDRDNVIVHSLLQGDHPWIVFPEGAMVKDKKVIGAGRRFEVWNGGSRRPPHRGAAALALRAEFYRQKLACLKKGGNEQAYRDALERLHLDGEEAWMNKRTFIVPVNITYFPIRADQNVFLSLAQKLAKDLSERALEELSIEGTVFARETDIDITFGTPIEVGSFLNAPEHASLVTCGSKNEDFLSLDPKQLFQDAADHLMQSHMEAIYSLTTVNIDHVLAGLLRYRLKKAFDERSLAIKTFECVRDIAKDESIRKHPDIERHAREMMAANAGSRLDGFLKMCADEGLAVCVGDKWHMARRRPEESADFHSVRLRDLPSVIANETEPIRNMQRLLRRAALTPTVFPARRARAALESEALLEFDSDYLQYYQDGMTKPADVGRPFLLVPLFPKAAVVLIHGYMAAPLEIRALAEYLYKKRFAVYGVRLKGHGTSPTDLARTRWQEWRQSIEHGMAVARTVSARVILGGFSMGAGLALLTAGSKGTNLHSVFAVDAPLRLRSSAARLAPSLVRVNTLLKWFHWSRPQWEYVDNDPENKHINYTSNPISGVAQLTEAMGAMMRALPNIAVPTLVLYGSRDPVVNSEGGREIFEKVGTSQKELCLLERSRHGIVNGPGSGEVFDCILRFIERSEIERTEVPPLIEAPQPAGEPTEDPVRQLR